MENNEQELDETYTPTYEDEFCEVGTALASLMSNFWQRNPDYAPDVDPMIAFHDVMHEFHVVFDHYKEQLLEADKAIEEDVSEE